MNLVTKLNRNVLGIVFFLASANNGVALEPEPLSDSPTFSGPGEGGGSGRKEYAYEKRPIDYASIAKAIRAGCGKPQTNKNIPFPTTVVNLDTFFVVLGKADWLPEFPNDPESGIHGTDADGDCVRDDIEYYIARKYGQKSQYKLRKYLYEYTVWMDHFLTNNISENTAKTAYRNMAAAGECVQRILGSKPTSVALNDLFAKFHNTWPRSDRYIDNLKQIGGWTTREDIKVSCP